jgi:hypothetical protein
MKNIFETIIIKEKFLNDCKNFDAKDLNNKLFKSYYKSYPEFLKYFNNLKGPLTIHNLIIGINFTYSWMPTIFKFGSDRYDDALKILNNAKNGIPPDEGELNVLKKFLNNSLVGTSKLLHFINPEEFAIWDSKVYYYLTGKKQTNKKIGDCNIYLSYLLLCSDLTNGKDYDFYHNDICCKIGEEMEKGYMMTKLRTAELVMWKNGKQRRSKTN